jgi:hypothetical protein
MNRRNNNNRTRHLPNEMLEAILARANGPAVVAAGMANKRWHLAADREQRQRFSNVVLARKQAIKRARAPAFADRERTRDNRFASMKRLYAGFEIPEHIPTSVVYRALIMAPKTLVSEPTAKLVNVGARLKNIDPFDYASTRWNGSANDRNHLRKKQDVRDAVNEQLARIDITGLRKLDRRDMAAVLKHVLPPLGSNPQLMNLLIDLAGKIDAEQAAVQAEGRAYKRTGRFISIGVTSTTDSRDLYIGTLLQTWSIPPPAAKQGTRYLT